MHYYKKIFFGILILIFLIVSIILFYKLNAINNFANTLIKPEEKEIFNDKFLYIYLLFAINLGIGLLGLALVSLSEVINDFKLKKIKVEDIAENITEDIEKNKLIEEENDKELELIKKYESNLNAAKKAINNIFSEEQHELKQICEKIVKEISKTLEVVQGEFFIKKVKDNKIQLIGTYAYYIPEDQIIEFEIGEGLIGQVAKEKKLLNLDNVPNGYITIASGLGKATPENLVIFPLVSGDDLVGIIELASFEKFTKYDEKLFNEISVIIADKISGLIKS